MKENLGNQNIDLYHLWYFFLELFNKMSSFLKQILIITKKKWVYIIFLLIISLSIGSFVDSSKEKEYKHEIILIPNFESGDYLYDFIHSYKPLEKSPIVKVELKPIVNINQFISKNENLQSAKYLSDNNINITDTKKGSQSEKIYKYHLLQITTIGIDNNSRIVKSFLDKLNSESHFLDIQKVYKRNNELKLRETLKSIENTNNIFEKISKENQNILVKSDFNIEMYPELKGLLDSKQGLLDNIKYLEQQQIEQSKIFYDVSIIPNIEIAKNIYYILLIPFIVILIFYIISLSKSKMVNKKN